MSQGMKGDVSSAEVFCAAFDYGTVFKENTGFP